MTEIIPTEEDPLLDTNQIAKICAVEPATVRGWLRDNKIPSVTLEGGRRRVLHSDLVKFVNKRYGDS